MYCCVSLHSLVTACESLGYHSNALPMRYTRCSLLEKRGVEEWIHSIRLARKFFVYIQKFKHLNCKKHESPPFKVVARGDRNSA